MFLRSHGQLFLNRQAVISDDIDLHLAARLTHALHYFLESWKKIDQAENSIH